MHIDIEMPVITGTTRSVPCAKVLLLSKIYCAKFVIDLLEGAMSQMGTLELNGLKVLHQVLVSHYDCKTEHEMCEHALARTRGTF